jgi:hypothetical protein
MELEDNNSIPFLDVLITRKLDGTLGHKVLRKKTDTNNYLHANPTTTPLKRWGFSTPCP